MYDIIILDCDGVIFDSNNLKLEAFRKTLQEYGDTIVNKFISYFEKNFGISRYKLVKVFITDFLGLEFDSKLNNKLLCQYSEYCQKLYDDADFTDYLIEFLSHSSKLNQVLYVASGSDEAELNQVMKKRDIKKFFKGIYGSPMLKAEAVKNIVNENKHKNILMIGDAISDMKAAKANNIDFIYMEKYSLVKSEMREMQQVEKFKIINNLKDLL